jgi:hypothetical protein
MTPEERRAVRWLLRIPGALVMLVLLLWGLRYLFG